MAVVALRIIEPAHGQTVIGAAPIRLHGEIVSSGHPPLTCKWYSSLVGPPAPTDKDASIRVPAGARPLDFQLALPLGSQVITLAAKDRAGESEDELSRVQHVGMAGGPAAPGVPAPCVIHVLRAAVLSPAAGAALNRANAALEAEAPALWGDADYQRINQVQFVWRFTPSGNPPGRRTAEIVLGTPPAVFDGKAKPPRLRRAGALPTLDAGAYSLTLRVQHAAKPAIGDAQSIPVTLV
jgi:hypothetical protein